MSITMSDDVFAMERAKFRLACFEAVTPKRGDLPNNMDVGYYSRKAQALFEWCVSDTPVEADGPGTDTAEK